MLTEDFVLSVVVIPNTSADLHFAACRMRGGPIVEVQYISYAYATGTYSKHAFTRSRSTSTSAQVGARTIHRILALSGTTAMRQGQYAANTQPRMVSVLFGAQSFPLTMPCTRWSGLICCLRTDTPEYARKAASRAFFPSHGLHAACALITAPHQPKKPL